jgi:hypothetical protein
MRVCMYVYGVWVGERGERKRKNKLGEIDNIDD